VCNEFELPVDWCLVNPVTYRYLYTGVLLTQSLTGKGKQVSC
jgi:hypothetical protein